MACNGWDVREVRRFGSVMDIYGNVYLLDQGMVAQNYSGGSTV